MTFANGGTASIYGFAMFPRVGRADILTSAATVYTPSGIFTGTADVVKNGAGGAITNNKTAARDYLKLTTDTTSGNSIDVNFNSSNVNVEPRWGPVEAGWVFTDSTITSERVEVAILNGAQTSTLCSTVSQVDTRNMIELCYDTGGAPGNTWLCCTANGVNRQCTDTAVTVATSTAYSWILDVSDGASLKCTINSTTVTAPAGTFPSVSADMGFSIGVLTRTAAARAANFSSLFAAEN